MSSIRLSNMSAVSNMSQYNEYCMRYNTMSLLMAQYYFRLNQITVL